MKGRSWVDENDPLKQLGDAIATDRQTTAKGLTTQINRPAGFVSSSAWISSFSVSTSQLVKSSRGIAKQHIKGDLTSGDRNN